MSSAVNARDREAPCVGGDGELEHNVRPSGWNNPRVRDRYNMVVVGGGTAGLVTAAGAAGLGARVALVERASLGGDCLNVGCVPSKALLRSARAASAARRAAAYGVRIAGDIEVDFHAVMERMRGLRAALSRNDSAQRFRDLGVDVYFGHARFVGPDALEVGGDVLRFARACIATGTRPAVPEVEGLRENGFLTNETLFSIRSLPARLAVIGGGPVGCEMAQAFARFGARVHLVEAAGRLLLHDDADAAALVEQALQSDGVDVRTRTTLTRVAGAGEQKRLFLASEAGAAEISVDAVLVAVGRTPNVESLGLEAAGIEYGSGGIRVDAQLRTSNRRVFAAGDVCSSHKFTHAADACARVVIRNALFFGRARFDTAVVPWCTYTDPEVAHVGLTPDTARARNTAIRTFTVELCEVDRARLDGEEAGFFRVHLRAGSDEILGATLVSAHAGETISEVTTAMAAGVGLGRLADTIHCYPTQAEAVRKAADVYQRARLTPRIRRALERLMALRR